jgi:integrase
MRDGLIFPSAKRTTPLSDMALSAVMRRMNADRHENVSSRWRDPDGREAVPHGFRATFSTWVDDTRPDEREAAEKALAHEISNRVSGAYRRSDLFDRRVVLMRDWAGHCGDGEAFRRNLPRSVRGTGPALAIAAGKVRNQRESGKNIVRRG